MNDRLLLLSDQGAPVELRAESGLTEERLRKLLLQHPQVLAAAPGSPLDEAGSLPVPWQMTLFSGTGPSGPRRLLDLLFIDAEGIPMFIATVRAADSRLRHEAIGELLEQASEAASLVTAEALRSRFHDGCEARGEAAAELLGRCLGAQQSEVNFWPQVAANLRAGRLRLALVAEEIPSSFQRSVEFLNRQFSSVELLAVELRVFSGEGIVAVAPRVWDGSTALSPTPNPAPRTAPRPEPPSPEAQSPAASLLARIRPGEPGRPVPAKASPPATLSLPPLPAPSPALERGFRTWDEGAFFGELTAHHSDEVVTAARRILAWARVQPGRVAFGQSGLHGGFTPLLSGQAGEQQLFSVRTNGTIHLACLAGGFGPRQTELLRRLNAVGGHEFQLTTAESGPEVPLAVIAERSRLIRFLAAFEWFVGEAAGVRN